MPKMKKSNNMSHAKTPKTQKPTPNEKRIDREAMKGVFFTEYKKPKVIKSRNKK